jgi:hypothetical protein
MTIQGNPNHTTNEANNRVPSMIKLYYYLAIQIWKLGAVLCEVYYGYV